MPNIECRCGAGGRITATRVLRFLSFLIVLGAAAPPGDDPVLARWDGGELRQSDYLAEYRVYLVAEKNNWERRSLEQHEGQPAAQRFLQDMVLRRLLRDEWQRRGGMIEPEALDQARKDLAVDFGGNGIEALSVRYMIPVEALERRLRDQLIRQRLYRQVTRDVALDQDEVERRLETLYPDEGDTWLGIRQIVVDDKTAIDALAKELKSHPREFAEKAKQVSEAPEAAEGGWLGVFRRGQLPEYIEEVVFALKPGVVSDPIRSSYGYHLFIIDRMFADVKAVREFYRREIEEQVWNESRERAFLVWLDERLRAANVEYSPVP